MGTYAAQKNSNCTCILDTSFLIDLAAEMLWALRAKKLFENDKSGVIVPRGVENEYKYRLNKGFTDDSGIPLLRYESLEALLGSKNIRSYSSFLAPIFGADTYEERRYIQFGKPRELSRTDKQIVAAAVELAESGKSVAVATADFGIVYEITGTSEQKNLDIDIYSPLRVPTKQSLSSLGLELLICGNVFHALYHAAWGDNHLRYLAVAKGMEIGYDFKIDICFGLYTRKYFTENLPRIEGVDFIPVVLFHFDESDRLLQKETYLRQFSLETAAIYVLRCPAIINIIRLNPIPLADVKVLRAKGKNNQLSDKDIQVIVDYLDEEYLEWARVEDRYIQLHNKLALGQLKHLRESICRN